jgi:hypothetical protein
MRNVEQINLSATDDFSRAAIAAADETYGNFADASELHAVSVDPEDASYHWYLIRQKKNGLYYALAYNMDIETPSLEAAVKFLIDSF